MVVFDNVIFSQERLKNSFITSLTSWTCLIYEGEYSIVNLLMCILYYSWGGRFLFSSFFGFSHIQLIYSRAWPYFVNTLSTFIVRGQSYALAS